jgi:hypothetical protein
MHCGKSADGGVGSYGYMTCERCGIRHNDVVSQDAVVGDMTVSHEKIVVADYGDPVSPLRASVEAHEFPEHTAVADLQKGRLSFIL